LLIAARQDVLKTHDIETLATLASRQWPHLVPSPHPLAYLTRWYLASRYPAIDDVAPSAEEVSEALRQSEIFVNQALAAAPALSDAKGKRH
jgi:hypothetical protein